MSKIDCPCWYCEERSPNCHGTCEKYKKYSKARQDRAEAIKTGRSIDKIFGDYHAEAVKKTRKKDN